MPLNTTASVDVMGGGPSSSSWTASAGVATDCSGDVDQWTGGAGMVAGEVGRTMSTEGILSLFVLPGEAAQSSHSSDSTKSALHILECVDTLAL